MLKSLRRHHDFMWTYSKAVLRNFLRPAFLYLTAFSLSLMAVLAVGFYLLEHQANPRMDSLFNAFYFVVTTITGVGFGDITPLTTAGRVLAILTMLVGTALFASFTAILAGAILEHEWKIHNKR